MRGSSITLCEVYSYGISTTYTAYNSGKYHLAANCSSLGVRAPQRIWGIQLDAEVVRHGAGTICGPCAIRDDASDSY